MDRSRTELESRLRDSEDELICLQQELETPPPDFDDFLLSILARKRIAADIEGYREATSFLEKQLKETRKEVEEQRQLLSDTRTIQAGLNKRLADAKEKRGKLSEGEIIRTLSARRDKLDEDLSYLLKSLIGFVDTLYPGDGEEVERERILLRRVLDTLMNHAWTSPADPYVALDDFGFSFPREMLLLLQRANCVVEHPRDAKRVRLVGFQKQTVS